MIILITKLACAITDFLYARIELDKEEKQIYQYGIEVLISTVISFLILLVLGLCFDMLFEAAMFFVVFYLLRRNTGGYHADTYLKCNIVFGFDAFMVLFVSSMDFQFFYFLVINIASFLGVLIAVVLRAPMESANKPIPKNKRSKYKAKAIIELIAFEVMSLAFLGSKLSCCVSLAMASVAIALIINKEGGNCDEEEYA